MRLDYEGAQALAEEARELASALRFPLPVVSTGIDLILNWARTGEVGRAEALIPEVANAVATAQGAHGWLWRLRFAQARAETAAARGDWDSAVSSASEALSRAKRTGRVKYEVAALGVRARALAYAGHPGAAAASARSALDLARATDDPAMILRAASQVLDVDPDEVATAAARAAAAGIAAALPEGPLRDGFRDSIAERHVAQS